MLKTPKMMKNRGSKDQIQISQKNLNLDKVLGGVLSKDFNILSPPLESLSKFQQGGQVKDTNQIVINYFVSIWVGQVHAPCVKSFTQKLLAHTRACRNRLLNHSKQIGVGCRRAEVTRFTNFDVHFYLVIIYHKVLKREDIEFKKMISQYHTSFLQ